MSPVTPLTQADIDRLSPEDQARLAEGTFRQPQFDTRDKHFKRIFGATRNGQPNREKGQRP